MGVELQKFIGSTFFGWDLEMFDGLQQIRAKANTSDLNEELGQVCAHAEHLSIMLGILCDAIQMLSILCVFHFPFHPHSSSSSSYRISSSFAWNFLGVVFAKRKSPPFVHPCKYLARNNCACTKLICICMYFGGKLR